MSPGERSPVQQEIDTALMTYCSHCDLVHGEEHRFCQVCGQLLKRTSAGLRPCPRCNAPTLPGQKFCTDCGLPLRVATVGRDEAPAAGPVFYPRSGDPRLSRRRRPFRAILAVLALLVLGFTFYFSAKFVYTRVSQWLASKPSQTVAEIPAEPKDNLKSEVEKLTEKIRASHMHKDIHKFMACYSPNYPKLGELEHAILELWKGHDIKEVNPRIATVKRLGDNQARAVVTMSFQLYDHQKQDFRLERQTYTLSLEKIGNEWKIRDSKVETAEPKT